MYVNRSSHAVTEADRQEKGRLSENTTDTSRELLMRSERPFRVRLASGMAVLVIRDGFIASASIDRVTKVPTGVVHCSPLEPLVVKQIRERPPQKPLPVLEL